MSPELLIISMAMHVSWAAFLYVVLTVMRAPAAWGIGRRPDGSNPWTDIEPRVSANLKNQFEWPVMFYVACLLQLIGQITIDPIQIWLAWTFVAGRIIHSGVQILTTNIRLRGVVFTINFVAVLGMWGHILFVS